MHCVMCSAKVWGGHSPVKPGKVGEFDIGRGKSRGDYGLPVVCCRSCDGHKISIS